MHVSFVPADAALSTPRVLVIEDDGVVASSLLDSMEKASFTALCASSGTQGIALKDSFRPHVILMNLTLPDMSGMALLSHLAEARDCGIIVICDLNDEADRIVGLELGADDYMAKPPRLRELVARIRAVHRRVSSRADTRVMQQEAPALHVGPIRINVKNRTVYTVEGRHIALTSAEFTALETLASAAGAAVSRDVLSKAALRRPWQPEDRSVDQLVFTLRQKLPADEGGDALIQSIRGSGYWLRAPTRAPVHAESDGRAGMAA